jgi:hypothetical protein
VSTWRNNERATLVAEFGKVRTLKLRIIVLSILTHHPFVLSLI